MNIKSGGRERTREMVRARDNWTCQDCGLRRGLEEVLRHNLFHKALKGKVKALDVHHLNGQCGVLTKKYDKVKDLSGMVTLCHKCHFNRPEHGKSNKTLKRVRVEIVFTEREQKIISMRTEEKKTIPQIAESFGVSKQRVHQILIKKGIRGRIPKVKEPFTVACVVCHKPMVTLNRNKRFCSPHCNASAHLKYPQCPRRGEFSDFRTYHKARVRWYYHNVLKLRSNWKEVTRTRNQRYAINRNIETT